MRMVQSHAAVALARPGRPQKGGGIKRLAFALSMACLFAPASARAQNAYITNLIDGTVSVIDTADCKERQSDNSHPPGHGSRYTYDWR
jgi:hypothetical protein